METCSRSCLPQDCLTTRRAFLRTLPAIPLGLSALLSRQVPSRASDDWRTLPAVIRAAFVRRKGDFWMSCPGRSYPVDAEMKRYGGLLTQAAQDLGVQLVMNASPIYEQKDQDAFIGRLKANPPDGVVLLVMDRHGVAWPTANALADTGIPSVIFAPIGTAFTQNVLAPSKKPGAYVVSSLEFSGVVQGMRMIRAAAQLRNTRILVVRGKERKDGQLADLGCRVRVVPSEDYAKEFDSVLVSAEVRQLADGFLSRAQKCVEPSMQDLCDQGRHYLAARSLMRREDADAITMDCLGLASSKRTPAPCLAWMGLNDSGEVVAGCEADMNAVTTMLLVRYLFDKPGYIQDPLPETVHHTLCGFHCTSASKLDGFDRPPAPYIIRSHHSDTAAAPQVLWRIGQRITIAQFSGTKKLIIASGEVAGNVNTPPGGGCRTDVEVKLDSEIDPRDFPGFHQVFFYGDHKDDLLAYCQMHRIEPMVV
ncbi:MAG: hypothetical protein FJX75_03290 [Armatimonadetes bacterium]|nr:hypothetical protein [Armatimonadota bacterium]